MHDILQTLSAPPPPHAQRRPSVTRLHNVELVDNYAWLRAANWQEVMRDPSRLDPEIRAHLDRENAYTDAVLAPTRALQEALFTEMKGRIAEEDDSVPAPDGPFAYFTRYVTGGQYPSLCRCPREGGAPEVLLDGNALAAGQSYWHLGGAAHSPDHHLLAYATDTKGSELYTIRIRNLATGQDFPEEIPDTRGEPVFANDSRTLFYVRLDASHRPLFVYRHTVGTPVTDDVLVYREDDPGFYVSIGRTQSGRFIVIDAHDHDTSEIRLVDADAPATPPCLLLARTPGHEYSAEHHGERLFILTNSAGAEDFRLCEAPLSAPEQENWREILSHKPGRLLLDIAAYKDHLVRLEREGGLPRLVVRTLASGSEHEISFPEEAYSLGLSPGYEFETHTVRFTYSSMTTPAQVFDYDMENQTRLLRKTQKVPSGHNPADYVTRRIEAPAPDGETVPVSLLYHKDTPLDGSAPVLLYGYGAYGISIPAAFSVTRLSLVDRGFIYAIAHIRGGKDKGYRWYREGKLGRKQNTFSDFIAAGEHLVHLGYTKRGRIIAQGGSAGGMLMGAVANQAPDLFLGIIADVPFVDVLNTMLDGSLPLTPPEWPEWGNPIESEADFKTILAYSPYENVAAKPYPHIFAYAGLTDPRVTYWEPAKWVAKLREKATGGNLILLKINMEAGHGGASGRFEQLREIALDDAFALLIAGKVEAPSS